MRRAWPLPLLVLALLAGACDNPSQPSTSFSVLGQWQTTNADSLDILMTISETARQIHGAGSWATSTRVQAFEVTGARVDEDVSLLFDFGEGAGVAFQGQFRDTPGDSTLMTGSLLGGSYRGTQIVFVRRDDD